MHIPIICYYIQIYIYTYIEGNSKIWHLRLVNYLLITWPPNSELISHRIRQFNLLPVEPPYVNPGSWLKHLYDPVPTLPFIQTGNFFFQIMSYSLYEPNCNIRQCIINWQMYCGFHDVNWLLVSNSDMNKLCLTSFVWAILHNSGGVLFNWKIRHCVN